MIRRGLIALAGGILCAVAIAALASPASAHRLKAKSAKTAAIKAVDRTTIAYTNRNPEYSVGWFPTWESKTLYDDPKQKRKRTNCKRASAHAFGCLSSLVRAYDDGYFVGETEYCVMASRAFFRNHRERRIRTKTGRLSCTPGVQG